MVYDGKKGNARVESNAERNGKRSDPLTMNSGMLAGRQVGREVREVSRPCTDATTYRARFIVKGAMERYASA